MVATKQIRVRILQDSNAGNPRKECDNLGHMVCWHKRYKLGDDMPTIDPQEYRESLPKGTLILPLYLYDHSGITMSCSAFSCPWDSGQVGYIYITPDTLRKEYGNAGKKSRELATKVLMGEVSTYDDYLTGNVYGFILEESEDCNLGDVHWTEIDSCWGFYGYDPFKNGISDHIQAEFHDALRNAIRG